MNNTEYLVAAPADHDDCLDFGNFVFSQAHAPHDFKALLPKVYGDSVCCTVEARHFIARRDGRIRAMVACLPTVMHYLDRQLSIGFVGTVSVHPYSRGEGHMKRLMADMLADAKAQGYDMLALGGQRQRYGYFGFTAGGIGLSFTVTSTNLRHCAADLDVSDVAFSDLTEERPSEVDFAHALSQSRSVVGERSRERFLDVVHSWKSRCRLVRIGSEMVGYVMGEIREIVLTDEELLPKVLKALFAEAGLNGVEIVAAPCEVQRIRVLSGICECCRIGTVEMVNILNWSKVLETLLALKASYQPLLDGCAVLSIDGEVFTIRVENNVPSVTCGGEPELSLSKLEAENMFFGVESMVVANPLLKNWLPLPFYMPSADTF